MNDDFNSRNLHRRLDMAGTVERVQKLEQARTEQQQAQESVAAAAEQYRDALLKARKAERQAPQQVGASSVEARERGLRSHDDASYRRIDMQKLKGARPDAVFFG